MRMGLIFRFTCVLVSPAQPLGLCWFAGDSESPLEYPNIPVRTFFCNRLPLKGQRNTVVTTEIREGASPFVNPSSTDNSLAPVVWITLHLQEYIVPFLGPFQKLSVCASDPGRRHAFAPALGCAVLGFASGYAQDGKCTVHS